MTVGGRVDVSLQFIKEIGFCDLDLPETNKKSCHLCYDPLLS